MFGSLLHLFLLPECIAPTKRSATFLPIIFADGKLGSKLFIQQKEKDRRFISMLNVFKPSNVVVVVTATGRSMTTKTTETFFNEVFFPDVPDPCLSILDSWSLFKRRDIKEWF